MTLKTTYSQGILRLQLDRPKSRNALTCELRQALCDALTKPPEGLRLVQLVGDKDAFCAGQDLKEFQEGFDVGEVMKQEYLPILQAIEALNVPIIAGVQGACAGAGISLALACDLVIASKSAYFQMGFPNIGLVPDILLSHQLPKAIGQTRAMGMALSSEPIDAETAESWGMIWRVLADDEFEEGFDHYCHGLSTGPSFALGLTRKLLRAARENDGDAQFALEVDYQKKAAKSADFAEAILAFKEKRPPKFRGK